MIFGNTLVEKEQFEEVFFISSHIVAMSVY